MSQVIAMFYFIFRKNKIKTSIISLSTVSLLRVNVPVLSLHNTSIPAISSIAVILFVIAPCNNDAYDQNLTTSLKSYWNVGIINVLIANLLR